MRVITRAVRAQEAHKTWMQAYPNAKTFLAKLEALGPNPSPDAVDEVFSDRHCDVWCVECGTHVQYAVELTDAPMDETYICFTCLKKAIALLSEV